MKKILLRLFSLSMSLFFVVSAYSAEIIKDDGLELNYSAGYLSGDVKFQVSSPASFRSLLEYAPKGYHVIGGGARYQLIDSAWPKLILAFEGLTGSNYDGTQKDSDWLYPYDNSLAIYSEADFKAKHTSYDAMVGWELINNNQGKEKLNLIGGYAYEQFKFTLNNITTLIWDYAHVYDVVLGRVNMYEAKIKGLYAGIENRYYAVNNKLRIDASVKYLPKAQGEGFTQWEMRGKHGDQSGSGDGYKMSVGATYKPKDNWAFGLKVTKAQMEISGNCYQYWDPENEALWVSSVIGNSDLDFIKIDTYTTELQISYLF